MVLGRGRVSVTLMAGLHYIDNPKITVNRTNLARGVVCGHTSRFLVGWCGGSGSLEQNCKRLVGRTNALAESASVLGLDARSSTIVCSSDMKGSWGFVKRAMKTLVSPPVVIALGASVLGAGIWGTGNAPLGKYANKHKHQISVRSHVGVEGSGKSPVG
jgi:hypothetical protein